MGLFDRKKRADGEDEDVELKAKPQPPPLPGMDAEFSDAFSIVPEVVAEPPLAFGIDEAIALVRTLPSRSTELVMQVVKRTLESVGVDVARIIESAAKKEQAIEARIGELRAKIEELEGEIAAHKKEIASLEADQREVSSVKERMVLAQRLETGEPSDRPAPGARPATVSVSAPPPAIAAAPEVPAPASVEPRPKAMPPPPPKS